MNWSSNYQMRILSGYNKPEPHFGQTWFDFWTWLMHSMCAIKLDHHLNSTVLLCSLIIDLQIKHIDQSWAIELKFSLSLFKFSTCFNFIFCWVWAFTIEGKLSSGSSGTERSSGLFLGAFSSFCSNWFSIRMFIILQITDWNINYLKLELIITWRLLML